jgi:hypothetical protein
VMLRRILEEYYTITSKNSIAKKVNIGMLVAMQNSRKVPFNMLL